MSNKWKDRIIRGGFIAVGTVAAVGCVTGLIGRRRELPLPSSGPGASFSPWLPASALLVSSP